MKVEIVGGKGEVFAGRGVGTSGWLQHSVLVIDQAIAFVAVEVVLEGMYIGNVRAGSRSKLCKLVGGEGRRAE